jgi:hypothetical protein
LHLPQETFASIRDSQIFVESEAADRAEETLDLRGVANRIIKISSSALHPSAEVVVLGK